MNINYPPYAKQQPQPLSGKAGEVTYIEFKDPSILESLDMDKLSYQNAKSILTLGGVFMNNESIQSFDEFRFFGVKSLTGTNTFKGDTNLTTIILPKSCNEIGPEAFKDCINLKRVIILGKNPIIDMTAFLGCSSLIDIETPNAKIGIGVMKVGSTFRIW